MLSFCFSSIFFRGDIKRPYALSRTKSGSRARTPLRLRRVFLVAGSFRPFSFFVFARFCPSLPPVNLAAPAALFTPPSLANQPAPPPPLFPGKHHDYNLEKMSGGTRSQKQKQGKKREKNVETKTKQEKKAPFATEQNQATKLFSIRRHSFFHLRD